ncbi:MAG TPA: hypothetical protein VI383_08955 [Gemmatimonadales bacterium]|nr:hypothetical protein [Gemmatimonadales bacterium]
MPCLLLLLALAAPRLTVVGLWLFTQWFQGMFPSAAVPLLGFIFLPTTLLWYSAVQHWFGGQWSFWPVAGVVIALMIDLSPARGRRHLKRGGG